jgi:uncharacterized protein (DUF58 family)
MLTTRGWWFLTLATAMLLAGATFIAEYTVVPAILAVTLVAWFIFEWILFQTRINTAAAKLKVTRRLMQGGREVPMVWSGLPFEVRLKIETDAPTRLPFVMFEDRLPQVAEMIDGWNDEYSSPARNEPTFIRYTLTSPAPGMLRFEGVKTRIGDLHGFFYTRLFLHDETEYLILPPLADDEGKQRADKRFNTLPPPGIHRLRRPGSGGELLDLRDYRPGDPPKMIAWKASARRDRLITKEYESDVPVRCVLLLDTSDGMRLGPPARTPLARMAGIASGVAQASAGNRDLVGLSVFDEEKHDGVKPARTKIHMIGMLRRLAEAAGLQPSTKNVPPNHLTNRALPIAEELYPELMGRKVNGMPFMRLWKPLLDRWWGWIVLLWIVSPIVIPGTLYFGSNIVWRLWAEAIAYLTISFTKAFVAKQLWFLFIPFPTKLFFAFMIWVFPIWTGLLFWGIFGLTGQFGFRARETVRRKKMSAFFSVMDGTGAGGVERLIHDDAVYSERVGRFLQERQIRMPLPLYDERGQYRFRCGEKAAVAADALTRAVSRARDNELYVLLADLAEVSEEDLAPLLRAAKFARARHHQVMVIIPWPADLPSPEEHAKTAMPGKAKKKKKRDRDRGTRESRLMPLIQDALMHQYHESFRTFRRRFGQVGATVVRVNDGDPVQVVLDRLDRMRGMRSRR